MDLERKAAAMRVEERCPHDCRYKDNAVPRHLKMLGSVKWEHFHKKDGAISFHAILTTVYGQKKNCMSGRNDVSWEECWYAILRKVHAIRGDDEGGPSALQTHVSQSTFKDRLRGEGKMGLAGKIGLHPKLKGNLSRILWGSNDIHEREAMNIGIDGWAGSYDHAVSVGFGGRGGAARRGGARGGGSPGRGG